MSTVNASEALAAFSLMQELLVSQDVRFIDFDQALAVLAAAGLRPSTKRAGLSFADRACGDGHHPQGHRL